VVAQVAPLPLYCAAAITCRLGKRRTLAEMLSFAFVAAVAVGAMVGRVTNVGAADNELRPYGLTQSDLYDLL
jgi:hypothetical protein